MKEQDKQIQRRDAGFSMIELLLVVVIIGILTAVSVTSFKGRSENARITAAKASMGAVSMAIDIYEVDNGKLPENLQNLITKGGEPNWQGPYLKKAEALKDPWGKEFQYSKQNNGLYELISAGADGSFGGADDIK